MFSKASNLNDSIFGRSAEPIMMFLDERAEAYQQLSAIPKLFHQKQSKNFAEKITSMTSMEGFQPVGEGGAYPKDEQQEGYSKIIEFETWKDQFTVTKEMMEDGKLLDFGGKPLGFITGYHRTREKFGANLFASGILGAQAKLNGKTYSTTGADAKPVFAADHPAKVKGAVQSNRFAGEFSVDNLSKMENRMQGFRDDNGNILAIAPDTIVIPNDWKLKRDVFSVIGADKDPNTANNGFNYQFGRWNVIVWPYLNEYLGTDKQVWILLDSNYNEIYGGAVWLDRVPLTVSTWVDNNNDNNVWNGRARFMAGFNDWRFAAVGGVTGATTL